MQCRRRMLCLFLLTAGVAAVLLFYDNIISSRNFNDGADKENAIRNNILQRQVQTEKIAEMTRGLISGGNTQLERTSADREADEKGEKFTLAGKFSSDDKGRDAMTEESLKDSQSIRDQGQIVRDRGHTAILEEVSAGNTETTGEQREAAKDLQRGGVTWKENDLKKVDDLEEKREVTKELHGDEVSLKETDLVGDSVAQVEETNMIAESSVFMERTRRRAEVCRNNPSLAGDILKILHSNDPSKNLVMPTQYLVYNDFNVLYCQVPKAASTNFKRLILLSNQSSNRTGGRGSNETLDLLKLSPSATWGKTRTTSIRLQNVNESFSKTVIGNFTKVLIVRHPFERLISYYRMLFETATYENFNNKNGAKQFIALAQARYKRPHPNYHPNGRPPRQDSGAERPLMSFEEFVQFVIDSDASIRNRTWSMHHWIDAHWMPISRQCHPCALDYDFICKVETLDSDLRQLAKHLGIAQEIKYPETLKRTSHTSLNEYINTLSTDKMKRLISIFRFDFELFGYKTEIE